MRIMRNRFRVSIGECVALSTLFPQIAFKPTLIASEKRIFSLGGSELEKRLHPGLYRTWQRKDHGSSRPGAESSGPRFSSLYCSVHEMQQASWGGTSSRSPGTPPLHLSHGAKGLNPGKTSAHRLPDGSKCSRFLEKHYQRESV